MSPKDKMPTRGNTTNESKPMTLAASAHAPLDSETSVEIQALVFALIDEQITDAEFARLQSLILSSAAARQVYIECVQLHVDLQQYFKGNAAIAQTATAMPIAPLALPTMPMPGGHVST